MTSSTEPISLTLQVQAGADTTPEEVDELARQLLAEVRQLEVESAELLPAGPAPKGTKTADPVTLDALALVVLPGVIPKIVEFVQAWLIRGQGRSVKFKGKMAGQDVEFEGSVADLKAVLSALSSQAPSGQPTEKPAQA